MAERTVELSEVAAFQVTLWHGAASRQLRRLREGIADGPTSDIIAELCFLFVSLANLIRAITRYRNELTVISSGRPLQAAAVSSLDGAIAALASGIPTIKELRDVAAHIDEYSSGTGRLQPSRDPVSILFDDDVDLFRIRDADRELKLDVNGVDQTLYVVGSHIVDAMADWED
jgi:hypothetical protein